MNNTEESIIIQTDLAQFNKTLPNLNLKMSSSFKIYYAFKSFSKIITILKGK